METNNNKFVDIIKNIKEKTILLKYQLEKEIFTLGN